MLSPLKEDTRVGALLCTAFTDWRDAVELLRGLANRQLASIATFPDGPSLDDILRRKSVAYEQADAAARNALALREYAGAERWADTEGLRDEIEVSLDDLGRVEAQSRELLGEQMRSTQAVLERAHRGENATAMYAGANAGPPRFLDQRR